MSGEEQFRILHQHWATSDQQTRAILVSTYAKLANLYEECRPLVAPVFARCKNSVDVEIQQRTTEYSAMREAFSPEAVEDLLRECHRLKIVDKVLWNRGLKSGRAMIVPQ
jgi:AP-2 complex subunit alpha